MLYLQGAIDGVKRVICHSLGDVNAIERTRRSENE